MPVRMPRRAGMLLQTGQTTQYSSELDDGFYRRGLAKSYAVLSAGAQSLTTNVDLTHLVSATGAFTAGDQTYTDAGKCGVFKAAGGETIVISGSVSNNGTFTTVSATANTVVVTAGFANEAVVPSTTFKKREAKSNNCVQDNNTGLMWARYVSGAMGTGGDGKMPWTGVDYDIFAYCAAVNAAAVGGYSDWRVANLFELFNLCNLLLNANLLPDSTAFPTWPTVDIYIWTSTARPSETAKKMKIRGDQTGVTDGTVISVDAADVALQCALVRGG